jgi:GT2 family glycosyltransferase
MIQRLQELLLMLLLRPWKAARIIFWRITGRRVRARAHFRQTAATLPFAYAHWLRRCARADRAFLARFPSDPAYRLTVHLHFGADTSPDDFAGAQASVRRQTWPHWRLLVTTHDGAKRGLPSDTRICVLDGAFASHAQGLAAALAAADTEYLVPLSAECRLPRAALAGYVAYRGARRAEDPAIIYGDQDEFGHAGWRGKPWFKPEWDDEMFLAQDHLSVACAIPVSAARAANIAVPPGDDGVAVYRILLDMTFRSHVAVQHLHRIVVSTPPDHWRRARAARLTLLRDALAHLPGIEVKAGPFGTAVIRLPLPVPPPRVSIIVPTRDKVELLKTCIEGLLARTHYPNFEIIIADNDSVEPAARSFLDHIAGDRRVRVVTWPHAFNYSAINNFAIQTASGEYLCLLNNDVEIIDGDWLSELMRYAVRPAAGAVGARLLYPDRTIQHAGVVVGMGNAAGHAHRGLPANAPGYFAHGLIARRATAVTGACLIVRRDRFEAVGGLDEAGLGIAYNDVDLCLKLRRAGYDNYYVPSAVLIHHESKSRGLDMAPEHIERYRRELAVLQARWETEIYLDPTHHPVLNRGSETYEPIFVFRASVAPEDDAVV